VPLTKKIHVAKVNCREGGWLKKPLANMGGGQKKPVLVHKKEHFYSRRFLTTNTLLKYKKHQLDFWNTWVFQKWKRGGTRGTKTRPFREKRANWEKKQIWKGERIPCGL